MHLDEWMLSKQLDSTNILNSFNYNRNLNVVIENINNKEKKIKSVLHFHTGWSTMRKKYRSHRRIIFSRQIAQAKVGAKKSLKNWNPQNKSGKSKFPQIFRKNRDDSA